MENDNVLINRIKGENCSESFSELSNRHENLYYKICQKYSPALKSVGVFLNDVFDDKNFIIYKALQSFDHNKNTKFSTWLGNHARYHCLNFINSNNKYLHCEGDDLTFFIERRNVLESSTKPTDEEQSLTDQIFDVLSRLKDERIYLIYKERYAKDKEKQTWTKIAKKLNISTQTVINLHTKGRNILQNKMKTQKYLDFV
jgi:RNA polymerase sigma factor (sigma-70 family)